MMIVMVVIVVMNKNGCGDDHGDCGDDVCCDDSASNYDGDVSNTVFIMNGGNEDGDNGSDVYDADGADNEADSYGVDNDEER